MLNYHDIPTRLLISSLSLAGDQWRYSATEQLSQHFLNDNQILVEICKEDWVSIQASSISSAILLVCDRLPIEFSNYVGDAVDQWLDSPIFADRILKALFRQSNSGDFDRFNVMEKVMLASEIHPKNSILYNWGRYVSSLKNSEIISNDVAREIMSWLPYNWWYGLSLIHI